MDIGKLIGYIEIDDKQADEVFKGFPDKIKGLAGTGAVLAGVAGAAIAAALVAGVGAAINIEAANDKLAAQLGLTAPEAEKAGKVAGDLYSNAYGDSMESVNDAVASVMSSFTGMRDASSKDIESVTAKVMDLSTAMEVDVGRAAQVAAQMVTTGIAQTPTEALDLLAASMQNVPAALREDLMDAVDEYGPFFSSMGIVGAEAMGLLAKGAEQGMYGIDKAGDAVKEFTIRATDMSTASKVGYDAIGLSQEEMTNKLLAGGDTAAAAFDQIVGGLRDIEDPAAQSQAALALFGTPLEDLGVDKIPTFLASLSGAEGGLENVDGAAGRLGDTLNGNVATSWTTIQRQFEGMVAGAGATLLPFLQGVMDWAQANPELLQVVAVVIGILTAAFIGLTVATWAMNTALLANPITWLVIAIVALIAAVVLLVMHWDEVVAGMTELWQGFVDWFLGVMDAFLAWWNGLWTAVWEWIVSVWTSIVTWVTDTFNLFLLGLTVIGAAISAWWNGMWSAVGAFVSGVWNSIVSAVVGFFTTLYAGVVAIGATISGWWNGLWNGIFSFISTVWNNIVTTIRNAFTNAYNAVMTVGGNILSFFSTLWSNLLAAINTAWANIISFFTGIPGKILNAFTGAATMLTDIGKNIIDGLLNGLKNAWKAVTGWISNAAGTIADTFAGILGIHSPSRVFFQFGENIDEGLLGGLMELQPEIDRHMENMVTVPAIPDSSYAKMGPSTPASQDNRQFTYVAAENSSLSTEEELFDALSRPRADW